MSDTNSYKKATDSGRTYTLILDAEQYFQVCQGLDLRVKHVGELVEEDPSDEYFAQQLEIAKATALLVNKG